MRPAITRAAEAEQGWRAAIDHLAAADARLLAAEEELAAVRRSEAARLAEAAREAERAAAADERRQRLDGERVATQALIEQLEIDRRAHSMAASAADVALARAVHGLEAAAAALSAASAAADAAQERLAGAERRAAAVAGELEALRERREHGERLGARMAASGWRSLLDAVTAPEAAWPAIEAVVGGELDQAVTWTDGLALDALVDQTGGVARLLATGPRSGEGREAALAAVGGTRTLADWIGTDALPIALQRVAVAPTLGALLGGWERLPAGWAAVTEEGDMADGRGMIAIRGRLDRHGGESARLHARRRELSAEHERLAIERRDATAALEAAERERIQAAAAVAEAETSHTTAERMAGEARRTGEDLERRLAAAENELARVMADLAALDARASSTTGAAGQAVISRVEELAAAAAAALRERDEAAVARDVARDAWQTTRRAAEEAEARSSGRRRERSAAEARIAQLETTLPDHEAALRAMDVTLQELAAATTAAAAADARAAADQQAADAAREARRRQLLELERDTGGSAGKLGDLERAAQTSAIAASRAEDALATLGRERELALEGLPDEGDPALLTDAEASAAEAADAAAELATLDDAALEAEQRRVRRTLGQIGSVNPFAVEEHAELAGRLERAHRPGDGPDCRHRLERTS